MLVGTFLLAFVSRGLGETTSTTEETSLKVLSNNVGIFPRQIIALYPQKLKEKKKGVIADEEEKATLLAQSLISFDGDPDVLLLQEIWSIKARDRLIHDLEQKYPYCKHPSDIGAGLISLQASGLMVFSKLPIEDFAYKEFTKGFGPDKFAHKGIVGVRLIKNRKDVALFTTHLQAGGKNDPSVKPDQLRECEDFIKQFVGERKDDIVVLAGDFNIRSTDEEAYNVIFTQLPGARDSYKEKLGTYTTTTRNDSQPNKRIDYLLTFGDVKAESMIVDPAGPEISDHLAVLGTISLE